MPQLQYRFFMAAGINIEVSRPCIYSQAGRKIKD
jgi:hypothetical protein